MELDHIIPISMGGADEVENLQVCCMPDNRYTANILPSDFFNRISDIFLYQMDKKYNDDIRWKYCRGMIVELL